jgi:hypothetical protein
MGIYKQGLNRKQQLMFPPSLDELVDKDNVVRAIEAYADTLDIFKLNIKTKKNLIKDGQPAFHPKLLLKLITGDLVAVDGVFLRANASKNTLIMRKTVKKDLSKIDEDIKNYMTLLETLDKEDRNTAKLKISKEEIDKLLEKKEQFQKDLDMLDALGKEQHNKTDEDATVMSKPMAYNSQIAVDDTYKFIVATVDSAL